MDVQGEMKTQRPYVLVLLPAFFVLHYVNQFNMDLFSPQVYLMILFYSLIFVALTGLSWLLFRNFTKALLGALLLMLFYLFFGFIQDKLKEWLPNSFLTKYSVLLPLTAVVFAVLFFLIKKTKKDFSKLIGYFNLLFLIFLVMDLVQLVMKPNPEKTGVNIAEQLKSCPDCENPDIYLIVADEYAGSDLFREKIPFDNSPFEDSLRKRGFHLPQHPRSNYNFTLHSMASMLNMNYVKSLDKTRFRQEEVFICRRMIARNSFMDFLQNQGYEIFNHSYFDLSYAPKNAYHYYVADIKAYLNRQTLYGRIEYHLGFNFASEEKKERIRMNNHYNNQNLMKLTREVAGMRTNKPKFVYTHLSMPHHPYYFDRNGKRMKFEYLPKEQLEGAYVEYLQYSNRQLLQLIDTIQQRSPEPPVIMLISDHGFRQFEEPPPPEYYFMNFNAVCVPGKDASVFYDGITNVNQLRVLLNQYFGQRLPMLKDSTAFIGE